MRLPDGEGIELLDEIAARHPRGRLLLFSGATDDRRFRAAAALAGATYLEKPIDPALVARFDDWIREPSAGVDPAIGEDARSGAARLFAPDATRTTSVRRRIPEADVAPPDRRLVRTRFLVADRDAAEAQRWQAILRPYASAAVTTLAGVRHTIAQGGVVGLVLDASLDGSGALDLVDEVRAAHDRTPILVLHTEMEPRTVNRLHLHGATSVWKLDAAANVRLFAREAAEEVDDDAIRAAVKTWGRHYQLSQAGERTLLAAVQTSGYAAMGAALGLSSRTVQTQLQTVLEKTGYATRERLVLALVASTRKR
jgi:DNA-binding NarL/FixJ family response regulator